MTRVKNINRLSAVSLQCNILRLDAARNKELAVALIVPGAELRAVISNTLNALATVENTWQKVFDTLPAR